MSVAAALEFIGRPQVLQTHGRTSWHDGSGSLHDVELSLPSSPEPEEGDQMYKNEDLLNEIKQLKEEIKKKDEKIQLLEHRLATRCNCHQKSKEEKCTYADKYTQTPWRRLPPQVLQPSSSHPRSTDHAQGKLIKPQHTEAHSEHRVQGMCQEERPLSPSPQFTVDVVKDIPSETSLSMTGNAQEPHHLAKNQTSDMQFVPPPPQTPSQSSTVDQTKRLGRNQSPQLKSKHLKPSTLSSLVPPDSDSSPRRTSTYKKSPVIAPCNSKHQPTSNQNSLANNLNLKTSKLRPPSGTLKQKQISNSQLEPQNFQAKTSIPRPLARPKELQNPHSSLHSGDCVASNRYSRLPKPKIH